ncbi:hypothetical protein BTS2_0087 [Bacillus sp. TS-2]|nr:hypothetical protein BTS2_0087 [Bacillus sp. TS-2]
MNIRMDALINTLHEHFGYFNIILTIFVVFYAVNTIIKVIDMFKRR